MDQTREELLRAWMSLSAYIRGNRLLRELSMNEMLVCNLLYLSLIHICCKIVLANEEVVDGVCERCGGEVIRKEKSQWMLAITKYADRLIDDLEDVDFIERVKTQQRNWIGRSEGTEVDFTRCV